MENSALAAFVERVNADPDLRAKIVATERAAEREALRLKGEIDGIAQANLAAVYQIAQDAGFDITGSISRNDEFRMAPRAAELDSSDCWLTCCLVFTSAWTTEPFSLTGTGGPP